MKELGLVYFISNGTNIKIGFTTDFESRRSTLQTGNDVRLIPLYIIEDVTTDIEGLLHQLCERHRINGEWYSPESIARIQQHPWYKENMIPYREWKTKNT